MRKPLIGWILIVAGCSIGNGTPREVYAQDGKANISEAVLRPDLMPARFWIAHVASNSANTWESASPEIVSAVILDVNELEIIYASEQATSASRLTSARLQAIEVVWGSDAGSQAHSAFARGDFKTAIDLSKAAIANGNLPKWQQRILAAELTECLTSLDQHANACRVFISLCRESPAPLLYASAPLNWTLEPAIPSHVQLAKEWIGLEGEPTSQLIGASWLLIGSESSRLARTTLEKLGRSKSTVIAQLASAQLWRDTPPNQVLDQYSIWAAQRDRMLLPLQIGPTIAIANKLQTVGQSEASLQEWLRVLFLFPSNHRASKRARESVVELLKGLGRNEEAARMAISTSGAETPADREPVR